MKPRVFLLVALCAGLAPGRSASADVTVQFDYTYDVQGFFDAVAHPERRQILELAAASVVRFADDLAAIVPGGDNWWDAGFWRPDTGGWDYAVHNLVVPADTLIVYVGARDLPVALGEGGPGSYWAPSIPSWIETVKARGESGALLATPTDFGPWGGSIAFDSSPGYPWYFGASAGGLGSGQADFLSVASHELAHVLGFGTADSWDTWRSGLAYTGAASVAEYGTNVALSSDTAHWASGVKSPVDGVLQEASMTPVIMIGTRKTFTDLDHAGLVDVGWELIPAPLEWNGVIDNHWEKGANWYDGPAPGSGATALLDSSAPRQPRLYQDETVDRLAFRTAGWGIQGADHTLTVGQGGIDSAGQGGNAVAPDVLLGADSSWTIDAGNTLDLDGGLDGGGHILTKDGEGLLIVSGPQDHAAGSALLVGAGEVEMQTDGGPNLSIEITGGEVTFTTTQHLDELTIGAGGRAKIAPGGPKVLVLNSLWMEPEVNSLGAAHPVPEPATLSLLALGGLLLVRRVRR